MRRARVFVQRLEAGVLEEHKRATLYRFRYHDSYQGPAVSLTMPCSKREYDFRTFPPFFEGLLPEGRMLESLLKTCKIDRDDYFSQLTAVGADLVGAVTVVEAK